MYQIIVGTQQSCPANFTEVIQWVIGGGTIVSVALQNSGNAWDFWTSQMYPQSATEAYWQVVNPTSTAVTWWPVIVVDDGGADVGSAIKGTTRVVETKPLSPAKA